MIDQHVWMLALSLIILILTLCLVYPNKCTLLQQELELFDYSQTSAQNICAAQAQMVAQSPYIGGTAQAAYENCMKTWTPGFNMPSAYVTSANWVPHP